MANEVKIKLTDAQREKIREATGKDMPEFGVENFGNNPALSPSDKSVSTHISARKAARKFSARKAARKFSGRKAARHVSARKAARKLSGRKAARHVSARKAARKLNASAKNKF